MKVLVRGTDKATQETLSYVIEASDMTQAHRYCKQKCPLDNFQLRPCDDDMTVDIDFTEVQQYLSVKQYRRIRKSRGCSQFPVLEIEVSA